MKEEDIYRVECPYYIVNDEREFRAAIKALGMDYREPLHDFPMIIGRDDAPFQCSAKDHPIAEYLSKSEGALYVYELKQLP